MGSHETVLMLALTLGMMAGVPLCCAAAENLPPKEDLWPKETPAERDVRMKWWHEARFGVFIHWNLSSVPAGVYHGKHNRFVGEWLMHDEKIPVAEYKEYAKQFNPVKFNADEWVRIAKNAGAKYIVFTAKHHDGFAMYRTKISKWNICDATPFGRDPLKELAEACRKQGLKFGLYYSQAVDGVHPGGRVPGDCWDKAQVGDYDEYLRKIAVPQVREILTGYGPISVIWWDGPWEMTRERANLFLPLLKLQPGIIMNDRLGGEYPGDAASPEQGIPEGAMPGRDWETCMTMNDTWGYKSTDNNWKSAETLIRMLADIASKGGNFLLNVGPTAEGLIPEPSVTRLKQVGQWMKVNGEAIYGTSASPFKELPWGRCTKKTDDAGTTLYLLVFNWPDGKVVVPGLKVGSDAVQLVLPGLKNDAMTAYMLADPGKQALDVTGAGTDAIISVPRTAPDKICSVVVLRVRGALDIDAKHR